MSVLDAFGANKGGANPYSGSSPFTAANPYSGSSPFTPAASSTKGTPSTSVAGTTTSWHMIVLWFLGAVAMLALADPAPGIATALVLLIILGTLLNNWPIYKNYLGIK